MQTPFDGPARTPVLLKDQLAPTLKLNLSVPTAEIPKCSVSSLVKRLRGVSSRLLYRTDPIGYNITQKAFSRSSW
jgi:hypothetical protein